VEHVPSLGATGLRILATPLAVARDATCIATGVAASPLAIVAIPFLIVIFEKPGGGSRW